MQEITEDAYAVRGQNGSPKSWYLGLDGVRAIAVLLVFSLHYAEAQTLAIGWIGVLIFFVLSGFLITGILYDNREEPHRFRNFYVRRTLRIFPLFYFTWILVFLLGLLLGARWHSIQVLWLVYLGNYVRFIVGSLARDHIYTQNSQLTLEIGHLWSLAVEEQFYLFWPLVVLLVRKRDTLIRICIAAVLFVPLLRLSLYYIVPERILSLELLYRLTITQCDGFLLGGLMALLIRGSARDRLFSHAGKIFYIPLILLVCTYFLNNGPHLRPLLATLPWMSIFGFTLVNFMAAGLILLALQPTTFAFAILTKKPLVLLGKYSYGFYVYHVLAEPFLNLYIWPVRGQATPLFHLVHFAFVKLLHFSIVLALSICSYHVVEAPFLRLKDRFTLRHRTPGIPNVVKLRASF